MWRVVIAEDEVLLTMTLRAELEAYGVEVVGTAFDGATALELCRQTHPDAVIMDLRMPLMDGIEATRRIMAECPTRVIVLTALSRAESLAEAQQAGAACFISKPAGAETILKALAEHQPARTAG